jgi:hypothetical protein
LYGRAVLPGLIKISIFVPLSLWCIALQRLKLMQADEDFRNAFLRGMFGVCFQLANDRRTFGALRVCCSFFAAENVTSILSDYRSQTC